MASDTFLIAIVYKHPKYNLHKDDNVFEFYLRFVSLYVCTSVTSAQHAAIVLNQIFGVVILFNVFLLENL